MWKKLAAALMACAAFGLAGQADAMPLREALGHFESGATTPTRSAADAKVGSRREVSRFQILPQVWRQYSQSPQYRDPEAAWAVAEKVLTERHVWFTKATGREWDAVDLYIMWNAPAVYEKAHWERSKVSKVVLERAQRFANLLMRADGLLASAGNP
jgi:hypothetical protein